MAKKNQLGKGLRALISNIEDKPITTDKASQNDTQVQSVLNEVDITLIEVNPDQPRKEFGDDELHSLAESIKTHGIIQPITLRKLSDRKYQIISGERRFRAAQIAGLDQIISYIRNADDQELAEMALVENIQREDLNPLEVAFCCERLLREFGLTHDQLADRIGKSRSAITNYLRLLKLSPSTQSAIKDGSISLGHAKVLAGVSSPSKQLDILKKIIAKDLSVRATEELINRYEPKPNKKTSATKSINPYLRKIQDNLSGFFGVKTLIKGSDKKGEIRIPYSSTEELNEILDRIS